MDFISIIADQLNISWSFLSSLLGGCNSKATANKCYLQIFNLEKTQSLQKMFANKGCPFRKYFWKKINKKIKAILNHFVTF